MEIYSLVCGEGKGTGECLLSLTQSLIFPCVHALKSKDESQFVPGTIVRPRLGETPVLICASNYFSPVRGVVGTDHQYTSSIRLPTWDLCLLVPSAHVAG